MSIDHDPTTIAMNTRLSDIVSHVVKLKPAGRSYAGLCPFHDDRTPSLSVSDNARGGNVGLFHCFACGASGDVFEFVQRYYKMTFVEALEALGGERFLDTHDLPPVPTAKADKSGWVHRIWNDRLPLHSFLPAGIYLERRGIRVDELNGLENLGASYLDYRHDGGQHPVLLAAIRDANDQLVGVQRTFLTLAGQKLDVETPKMSLGTLRGGAVKFGTTTEEIITCEGVEDALSIRLAKPNVSVWAAAGGNLMPSLPIPDSCTRLVIARDNDKAGARAAHAAEQAFRRKGRKIVVMKPGAGFKDFNEELLAGATV